MLSTYFKMTDHPFPEIISTDGIHRDDRIKQGLARLNFMAENAAMALVTGEPGVGKSTLIKLFLALLEKNRFFPVYIHLTRLGASALLKIIVNAFSEVPAYSKDRVMMQIIDRVEKNDLPTILIIDEAQFLDPKVFIDLRLLVSSAVQETNKLKIVFVGQPDLLKILRRSEHMSLVQRITVSYHLKPLSMPQTHQYINFHLHRVGCPEKLFDDTVKNKIYEHTRGIPRLINNISTACLLNGVVENKQKIDEIVFANTMEDFRIL